MSVMHLQPAARVRGSRHRYAPTRGGLLRAGHRMRATLHEWHRRARERAELARLDDHELLDIGLSRADAEFLANKPFWKE
jgi:uncharacterized protein YjiS (DUF1127 family)